jgi:hypothetical protein
MIKRASLAGSFLFAGDNDPADEVDQQARDAAWDERDEET